MNYAMEWTEEQKKIIDKAEFYRANEIKAHVLITTKGKFRNGMFVSHLEEDRFFWFIEDNGDGIAHRFFLIEIYDIIDYVEAGE